MFILFLYYFFINRRFYSDFLGIIDVILVHALTLVLGLPNKLPIVIQAGNFYIVWYFMFDWMLNDGRLFLPMIKCELIIWGLNKYRSAFKIRDFVSMDSHAMPFS